MARKSKDKMFYPLRNQHNPHTLYAKIDGKYVPVADHMEVDYWRRGVYLVRVMPGSTAIKTYLWQPDLATVEAALQYVGDGMAKAMLDASGPVVSRWRCDDPAYNEAVVAAAKTYRRVLRKRLKGVDYGMLLASVQDTIEAGLQHLRDVIEKQRKGLG